MKTVAIITAAGAGIRMGGEQPKQFLELEGRPLLAFTVERFSRFADIDGIVLVVPVDRVEYVRAEIVEKYNLGKVQHIVAGGERRQDSVRLGLEATEGRYPLVLIHDGVRPLVSEHLIRRIVSAAQEHHAVIPALPPKETVKEVDRAGLVVRTHDRKYLRLVQTPQAFRYEEILKAHRRALEEHWEGITDDAVLMERMGIPVKIIEGSEENIKITTPRDFELARFLLGRMPNVPKMH